LNLLFPKISPKFSLAVKPFVSGALTLEHRPNRYSLPMAATPVAVALSGDLFDIRSSAMPRGKKADQGYLVAETSGFPGVRIPLLSDQECRARGIEPGRWPPRETWTQAQRDAADRLADILRPHVFQEAVEVILAELEREPADSKIPEAEMEQVAARPWDCADRCR
jgi:hypothetical protein